jgi:hypothetical protein
VLQQCKSEYRIHTDFSRFALVFSAEWSEKSMRSTDYRADERLQPMPPTVSIDGQDAI